METTATLGEQIMLLSLDDESGVAKEQSSVHYAVAGAVLTELALAGRIAVGEEGDREGRVLLRDAEAVGDAAADLVLERVAARDGKGSKPQKPKDWIFLTAGKCVEATRTSLVDKGFVREERKKFLGVIPAGTRYPEADGAAERELRAELSSVVLGGAEPDDRLGALIGVLHGAKLVKLAFPDASGAELKQVQERMKDIAEGHWAGAAVGKVIESVQTALLAAVLTTTVTTTTATGS